MVNNVNQDIISSLVICAVSVLYGVILGNGAVFVFNRLPGQWFIEYGEDAESDKYKELMHPTTQRIRSTPWKYVFSGFFIVLSIYLGFDDCYYAFPAVNACWLLLMMAISDIKYMIVPDQFIMLLLITGIGFLSTKEEPFRMVLRDSMLGLLFGAILLIVLALLSRLIYKTPGIGAADIKLYAVLGFLCGIRGIIVIFVLATFLSAGHFILLMFRKRASLRDQKPMIPYIAIAAGAYICFLHSSDFVLSITL